MRPPGYWIVRPGRRTSTALDTPARPGPPAGPWASGAPRGQREVDLTRPEMLLRPVA